MDCRGLFDSIAAVIPGKLLDKGMVLWLAWVRECFRHWLEELVWVPTESMLPDDLTKAMVVGSGLWPILYQLGWWSPLPRDDLEEDYVGMEPDGKVVRWRLNVRWMQKRGISHPLFRPSGLSSTISP